jgi:excisionase family DNA binding protein
MSDQADLAQKQAYRISEFCSAFGLSKEMVYREIRAERLQAVKVGDRTLIPADSALAWLKTLPTGLRKSRRGQPAGAVA